MDRQREPDLGAGPALTDEIETRYSIVVLVIIVVAFCRGRGGRRSFFDHRRGTLPHDDSRSNPLPAVLGVIHGYRNTAPHNVNPYGITQFINNHCTLRVSVRHWGAIRASDDDGLTWAECRHGSNGLRWCNGGCRFSYGLRGRKAYCCDA